MPDVMGDIERRGGPMPRYQMRPLDMSAPLTANIWQAMTRLFDPARAAADLTAYQMIGQTPLVPLPKKKKEQAQPRSVWAELMGR